MWAEKSFGKFFCCEDGTILCVWDGKLVVVWQKFDRLTNSCAVCFTNINVVTAVVVDGRSEVPAFETFCAEGEPLMFVYHGARARWDEGRTIKVKLSEEGVEG